MPPLSGDLAIGRQAPLVKRQPPPDLEGALVAYQKTPTPELADKYLSAATGVFDKAVRAYAGADTPTVRAKAKQIALQVAPRYEAGRVKPETYLLGHLQSLRRYGASIAAPVRVPDQVRLDQVRVARHEADLTHDLGRSPSDAELADRAGLPIDRIAKARGVGAAFVASSLPTGVETVVPSNLAAAKKTWLRYVYHDLPPSYQVVLEHTIGINGKPILTTTEIAKKLGVSAGAVSQRKAKIEKIMNEYGQLFGG